MPWRPVEHDPFAEPASEPPAEPPRGKWRPVDYDPFESMAADAGAPAGPEVPRETTWGEFAQGGALDIAKGFIRAPQALNDLGQMVTPWWVKDAASAVLGRDVSEAGDAMYQRGLDAADALKPEAYRQEQRRGFVVSDPHTGEITGLQMPSGERAFGLLAETIPSIPQFIAGGGAGARGVLALKAMPDWLARFIGYGTTNAALVAPGQYDETRRELLGQLAAREAFGVITTPEDRAEAERKALAAGGLTALLTLLTGGAGGATAGSAGKAAPSLVHALLRGTLADVPFEGAEEAGQQTIADIAAGKGFQPANTLEAGLSGAVAGAPVGAAVGTAEYLGGRGTAEEDVGQPPAAPRQNPLAEAISQALSAQRGVGVTGPDLFARPPAVEPDRSVSALAELLSQTERSQRTRQAFDDTLPAQDAAGAAQATAGPEVAPEVTSAPTAAQAQPQADPDAELDAMLAALAPKAEAAAQEPATAAPEIDPDKLSYIPHNAPNGQPFMDSKGRPLRKLAWRPEVDDLRVWLAAVGGITPQVANEAGVDPATIRGRANVVAPLVPNGVLVRKSGGGLDQDKLRERMQEDGWLPEDADDNDALDMIRQALDGFEPVHQSAALERQLYREAQQRADDEAAREQQEVDSLVALARDFGSEPGDFIRRVQAAMQRQSGEPEPPADVPPADDIDVPFSRRQGGASGDLFGAPQRPAQSRDERPVETQPGLLPEPTAAERVEGERRRREAGRENVPMREGEGELFAGPRPQQDRVPEPIPAATDGQPATRTRTANAEAAIEPEAETASGVPPTVAGTETAASRKLADSINRFHRGRGEPESARFVEVQKAALPDTLGRALTALEQVSGTRVVGVRNTGGPTALAFNGVTFRDGVLYVDVESDRPLLAVAAHEWLHQLRQDDPAGYRALVEEVERQGLLPEWFAEQRRRGEDRGEAVMTEELVADAVGDALTDPRFLTRLQRENPGRFRELVQSFLNWIDTMLDRWRDLGSSQFLTDVQTFRDVLADVLANDTKRAIRQALADGTVQPTDAFRGTSMAELQAIARTGELQVGESFEGEPGISAAAIGDGRFPQYGEGVGIIAPESAVSESGRAGEVLIDEATDPRTLRYVVGGRIVGFDEMVREVGAETEAGPEQAAPDETRIAFSRRTPESDRQRLAERRAKAGQSREAVAASLETPQGGGAATWDFDTGVWEGSKGKRERLHQELHDRMRPFLRVQNRIEEVMGRAIPDAQNVYRLENLMHGRVGERMKRLEAEHERPLIDAMRDAGVDAESLGTYLMARYAKDRNAAIAAKNPRMPDGGSGITNAEAERILSGFDRGTYEPLARKVYAIRDNTRRQLLAAGLITQEQFDAMMAEKLYVPLRGRTLAPTDMDLRHGGGAGRGLDMRAKVIKAALGRGAGNVASNVLGEVLGDAQRAILLAEKARVGRALLRLVLANPNPELWTVEPVETEMAEDAFGEVYERVVNNWSDPQVVAVRHRGKLYAVRLAGPLAVAFSNIGVDALGPLTRAAGRINRYIAAVRTRYSPPFIAMNAARDAVFGLTGLAVEHGELAAAQAALFYPLAIRAAWRHAYNKPARSEADALFKRYVDAGGKTSVAYIQDADEIQRRIGNAALNDTAEKVKRAVEPVINLVEYANDAVENALRFAAFKVLTDRGMSDEAAAEYAKNLTVNFNRKGTHGSRINSWVLFYNASVQGAKRSFAVMKRPKAMAYVGTIAALQAVATMFAMGVEDEDGERIWNKIPDHVKRRNLVFVTPDGGIITWPLPYGFNVLPYLAGRVTEAAIDAENPDPARRRYNSASMIASDVTATTALSFAPVPIDGGPLGLVPEALQPGVQVQANRDDFGGRIHNDAAFSKWDVPLASLGRPDTLEVFKMTARGLNRIGGGTDYVPPSPAFDYAPEDIEHVLEWVGGGLGQFVVDVAMLGQKAYTEGPMTPNDVPISSKFARQVDERAAQLSLFYDRRDAIERSLRMVRDAYRRNPADAEFMLHSLPELEGAMFKRRKRRSDNGPGGGIITVNGVPQLTARSGSAFEAYRNAAKAVAAAREATAAEHADSAGLRQRAAELRRIEAERTEALKAFTRVWNERVVGWAE